MTQGDKKNLQSRLQQLDEALNSGEFVHIRRMLNNMPAVDVGHLIESAPPKLRTALWQLVDIESEGEILQYLSDEVQGEFLRAMDTEEVVAITENLDTDDIADILQQLPDRVIFEVLESMDEQNRHRVEKVLTYDENTAGGLMDTDTITVRAKITVDVVLRYLRRHPDLPAMTDSVIVVNRDDKFVGLLPLRRLLVAELSDTVREIMITDFKPIRDDEPATAVAQRFAREDLVSAPVVNADGTLVGRITIDDVVDVLVEDADHSLLGLAGLDEDEDTFAPVMKTAKRRAVWLGINLLTTFIAAGVINLFEQTIDKVVALAILMPIVASMGGVAGTQTLTVVIRGMALGQIGPLNRRWLLTREIVVGFMNGVVWALLVAAVTAWWFNDTLLGFIIALAMVINMITAGAAGAVLPLLLKSMRIDPALAGGVALTTVTDVVGFMSFLGIATWFYA